LTVTADIGVPYRFEPGCGITLVLVLVLVLVLDCDHEEEKEEEEDEDEYGYDDDGAFRLGHTGRGDNLVTLAVGH